MTEDTIVNFAKELEAARTANAAYAEMLDFWASHVDRAYFTSADQKLFVLAQLDTPLVQRELAQYGAKLLSERYELRAKIAELEKKSSGPVLQEPDDDEPNYIQQIMDLSDKIEALEDEKKNLENRLHNATMAVFELVEYAEHQEGCEIDDENGKECTCGLAALLLRRNI